MNRVLSSIAGATATPPNRPSLPEFMRSTTPQGAKAQLEKMLADGKVDRAQLERLAQQAQALAREMGLK